MKDRMEIGEWRVERNLDARFKYEFMIYFLNLWE